MALALAIAVLLPLGGCQALGAWAVGHMSPIEWQEQSRIELPLTINSWGHVTVPVQVMGRDAMAVLDTGSSLPVITRSFATAAGVRIRGSLHKVNGQKRDSARDMQVQLGPVSTKVALSVVDDNDETPFILGAPLFLQAVVDMDFDAGRVTLIRPDAFEPPAGKPLAVKLSSAVPTIALQVHGPEHELCAMIDTGSNSGLSLAEDVINELALPAAASGRTLVSYGAFGEKYEYPELAPVDQVQVGGLMYRQVWTNHAPPKMAKHCANLLGMNVLYRHHLVFDLRNRRIWLLPRAGNQW